MAETKKKMNVVQLTFMVAVNMMGSGIIMLPANMAGVGAISLLSWVVTAVGSMAIAYGFAQAGIFNQKTGGMAAYAEDAYGKSGYFQVFMLYFLSLAIGNVAIAISAVGYMATFFPGMSATPIATCMSVIAAAVADDSRQLRRTERHRQDRIRDRVGRHPSRGTALHHRLVLVQQGNVRRSLESARIEPRPGHGFEHLADLVGLPRHGVRGAEL